MKQFFILCLVGVFLSLILSQDTFRLSRINRIYIDDLGRQEGPDLVREKLRLALTRSDRFRVVERPDSADAILTGVAGVERRNHSTITTDPSTGAVSGTGGTNFAGIGLLRLVDIKSDETIWIFEYKRGFNFGSASSRVASKAVEKLLKDTKAADRQGNDIQHK